MRNRFNTLKTKFLTGPQGRARSRSRQFAAAAAAAAAVATLAGCSSKPDATPGTLGIVEGFLGGVVADEPRAALIGRDILSSGGTAADAAAAMYFAMSVTLPSRAGLGGGGVCLAFDVLSGVTETVDFTARQPAAISPAADRPNAIPGNPRGFFVLQARHGVLPWSSIVAPAEQMARFGHPMSRVLAGDLKAIGPALLADPEARDVFADASGRPLGEGETFRQPDLAATLGLIRARGVGPFYTAAYAKNFVEAVPRAGGALGFDDLRDYLPDVRKTVRVQVGNEVAHFAPPPAAASTVAAVMFAMMVGDGGYTGGDSAAKAVALSGLSLRAFADRESWLSAAGQSNWQPDTFVQSERISGLLKTYDARRATPPGAFTLPPRDRHETPSSTVFAAADQKGNAVVCSTTMNAAFGTGRIVPGTGVLLAAAPGAGGRGPAGLAVMMVVNENTKEFRYGAGASGGVAAPSALASVAGRVLLDGEGLESAIAQPRVHYAGDPDVAYFEPNLDPAAVQALTAAGLHTAATPEIGNVNALACLGGLPVKPESCHMAVDPRGQGLAAGSMR